MSDVLKRTPLYDLHRELGARLVPCAGYEMPVQYPTGILAEHAQTRTAAGLFDVSHMGQVRLTARPGQNAAKAIEALVPGDIAGLAPGQQRYTQLTNDAGGILDDLMITSTGDHLLMVFNAACKDSDLAHVQKHLAAACEIMRSGTSSSTPTTRAAVSGSVRSRSPTAQSSAMSDSTATSLNTAKLVPDPS